MSSISTSELQSVLGGPGAPIVLDVRRQPAYREASETVSGALRRDPEAVEDWMKALPRTSAVVAYCVHGHEVSQSVVKRLSEHGLGARCLKGGMDEWKAAQGPLDVKPAGSGTRWVTRERPKIDRIACPWLIARLIDRDAEFLYVPEPQVREVAQAQHAVPYDVAGVHFTHEGERCSFDAFVRHYRLGSDPALERLALIVRAADTGRLDLAPQAAGLAAVSLGLSRLFADDHEMLDRGMVLYDALYVWCKEGQHESHTWNPQDALRAMSAKVTG
ncbi:chromate resistance protein ChrB domain-containing protein [Methylibium sp.]|uniref:chromate resistance protein ChrB domain-containing protein n=1 Tax=Methylibium sp. TaxID=2067992 RepID=UPI0018583C9B|nr:chromate resistance protein ChrB domain-containing protein [Methylibium sp.]MBA3591100.1 chromate resistance protein [Methylibium sp.]